MPRMFFSLSVILAFPLILAACQPRTAPPAAPQPTVAERLAAGKKALAAGDCKTALPELTEAVRQRPGLFEAQLYLGICAYKENDAARGEAALKQAMATDPNSPRPYEALGIAEYTRKHHAEARQALESAVSKGSKNPSTYYYLGNLAMLDGQCHAAFDAYRQALRIDPTFTVARTEFDAARLYCAKIGAHQ